MQRQAAPSDQVSRQPTWTRRKLHFLLSDAGTDQGFGSIREDDRTCGRPLQETTCDPSHDFFLPRAGCSGLVRGKKPSQLWRFSRRPGAHRWFGPSVVAFQTILEQFRPVATDKTGAETLSFDSAVLRLTFPTIITPYGVAAVIILTAIASDTATKFVIFLIAVGVLLLIYSPCSLHAAAQMARRAAVDIGRSPGHHPVGVRRANNSHHPCCDRSNFYSRSVKAGY